MTIDTDVLAAVQESLQSIDALANEQALVILEAFYSYLLKASQSKLEALRAEKENAPAERQLQQGAINKKHRFSIPKNKGVHKSGLLILLGIRTDFYRK